MKSAKIRNMTAGQRKGREHTGRIIRRGVTALLTAAVMFGGLAAGAYKTEAAEEQHLTDYGIDSEKRGTITLRIPETGEKASWYIAGSTFRLYKVANLGNDLQFDFTGLFSKYPEENKDKLQVHNPINEEKQTTAASTWEAESKSVLKYIMETYPKNSGLTSGNDYQVKQMENRAVTFSNLGLGLYLVEGDTTSEDNKTVTFQPVLICIPWRDTTTDEWQYTRDTFVKQATTVYAPTPSNVNPSGTISENPPKGTDNGGNPLASPPSTTPVNTGASPAGKTLRVLTGDTSALAVYVGIMIVAAAVICLIFLSKKKNKDKD